MMTSTVVGVVVKGVFLAKTHENGLLDAMPKLR